MTYDKYDKVLTKLGNAFHDVKATEKNIKTYKYITTEIDVGEILKPRTREEFVEKCQKEPEAMVTSYKIEGKKLRFETGALSIVAGKTGHGKTTFLFNLILDAVKQYPYYRHWIFTAEEGELAVTQKLLNTYCNVELNYDNRGSIRNYYKNNTTEMFKKENIHIFKSKEEEFWRLIENGYINIIPITNYSIDDLICIINELAISNPKTTGLICIDYIQLLYHRQKSYFIPRHEELKDICLQLKNIAVEYGLAIVVAAQIKRTVKDATDLTAECLSDASDIEKTANKVIAMWNDEEKEKLIFKILKARDERNNLEESMNWNGNLGKISNEEV